MRFIILSIPPLLHLWEVFRLQGREGENEELFQVENEEVRGSKGVRLVF
jgi:hypothetical protein